MDMRIKLEAYGANGSALLITKVQTSDILCGVWRSTRRPIRAVAARKKLVAMTRYFRTFVAIVLATWSVTTTSSAFAGMQALAQPTGNVVLEVTGAIARTNADGAAKFDMAMLEALPKTTMTTETAWTDGPQTFDGVKLLDLLTYLQAKNFSTTAYALNDYTVGIPKEDLATIPVLVAYRQNGQPMSIANKGPLWIIYPDSLGSKETQSKMIWQLRSLQVGSE
ncbi:MAG: molybdopterin-dependent oxidoreductase [Dongiaceae bacterium]